MANKFKIVRVETVGSREHRRDWGIHDTEAKAQHIADQFNDLAPKPGPHKRLIVEPA
jgi:hypothetical protein